MNLQKVKKQQNPNIMQHSIDSLQQRYLNVKQKANDRKKKLETECKDLNEFNDSLNKFNDWLAEIEINQSSLPQVSCIFEPLTNQINERNKLEKNIDFSS